jgi:hypothetical protein
MAEAAQMTPQQYYLDLVQRGRMRPADAMAEVQRRYGAPQSRQQQQENAQKQQDKSELASAAGMIGGVIAGRYLVNKVGKYIDMLTGKEVAEEVVKKTVEQVGTSAGTTAAQTGATATSGVTEASNQAWNAGADAATSNTPQVISSDGGMSTVQTPTGPQQVPTESLNDAGFWDSVNWGQVAQGGLAVAQLYGAYKAYQSGDKVGAGLSGATGAANLAGAAGADLGANVIPGLNIATGAYTGYKTAEAMSDMAAGSKRTQTGIVGGAAAGASIGAGIGTLVPIPGIGTAAGAAIGALVGATAGAVGSWTGSSKNKAQFMRDNIRGVLQKGGVLDDKFQGTLADGSKFDFGQDGSNLKWKNIDKLAAEKPAAWNGAVPLSDALAASYGFVGQKASDISAWYARAAVSNAGDDPAVAKTNMQHFAKQQGITFDLVKTKLDEAMADNRISQGQYDSYLAGARELTAGVQAGEGAKVEPPKKGQVARVSPGMYMNDQGQVSAAKDMRQALERNYGKSKSNKKKDEEL